MAFATRNPWCACEPSTRPCPAGEALTANEHKLCAYIKLGMSNKEVAEMLNVELGTVKSNINRLKKKLHLGAEDSFRQFIGGLG